MCSIENNVKVDKFGKCQNLNSLFGKINFPKLPQYSWNLQMLSIIEKFFWKIVEKLVRPLAGEVWHVSPPNWKLARLWHDGTPSLKIGTPLARWHLKMRSWHAFGTWPHGHVDHAGADATHDTQFSQLPVQSQQ